MEHKFTRSFLFPLTDAEKAEIGQSMSNKALAIEEIEASKKRVQPLRDDIADLARRFNDGGNFRDVECVVKFDVPETGKKTIIRLDTNEEIDVQDMTADELQGVFDFEEQPKDELAIPENTPDEKIELELALSEQPEDESVSVDEMTETEPAPEEPK
jgi:hypothetical protein